MIKLISFLVLGVVVQHCSAALPSYLKPCKNGPKLRDCAVAAGNAAIPSIAKGDLMLKLPVLDPLRIEEVSVIDDGRRQLHLNVTLKDVHAYNLKQSKLMDFNYDPKQKKIEFKFTTNQLLVKSKYKINGKILLLPIRGEGPAVITMEKPIFILTVKYKVVKMKGQDHFQVEKTSIKHTTQMLHIKLDNLFDGDKLLGQNMNQVLNDNWKEINEQIGVPMMTAVLKVMTPVINNLLASTPIKELFL